MDTNNSNENFRDQSTLEAILGGRDASEDVTSAQEVRPNNSGIITPADTSTENQSVDSKPEDENPLKSAITAQEVVPGWAQEFVDAVKENPEVVATKVKELIDKGVPIHEALEKGIKVGFRNEHEKIATENTKLKEKIKQIEPEYEVAKTELDTYKKYGDPIKLEQALTVYDLLANDPVKFREGIRSDPEIPQEWKDQLFPQEMYVPELDPAKVLDEYEYVLLANGIIEKEMPAEEKLTAVTDELKWIKHILKGASGIMKTVPAQQKNNSNIENKSLQELKESIRKEIIAELKSEKIESVKPSDPVSTTPAPADTTPKPSEVEVAVAAYIYDEVMTESDDKSAAYKVADVVWKSDEFRKAITLANSSMKEEDILQAKKLAKKAVRDYFSPLNKDTTTPDSASGSTQTVNMEAINNNRDASALNTIMALR